MADNALFQGATASYPPVSMLVAAKDIGGGALAQKNILIDPTTPTQMMAVDASGRITALAVQSGTWNVTNVSGTVSLPTGAATAAKQPALGTAGTASTDVITVQGIASMTPLAVTAAQATAASLNATVVGTGTFAVQESGGALTSLQLLDDVVIADDAAFTPATTKVLMVGATFDDVAPDSVNEGDAGAVRMSANRNLFATLRDAAGNERGANVSAGNALLVDGSATTQPVSGTVTANAGSGTFTVGQATPANLQALVTGAAADNAAVAGNPVLVAGKYEATPGTLTDGDAGTLRTDINGALHVAIVSGGGSGGTASSYGAGFPATGTAIGFTDGTNMVSSRAFDLDTGGGVQTVMGVSLRRSSSGGSVEFGNDTTPIFTSLVDNAAIAINKAEDAAHVTGDMGFQALAVRTDTPAARSGTDGDYEPLQTAAGLLWVRMRGLQTPLGDSAMDDTNDAVRVNIVAGAAAGGTAQADRSTFTDGTTTATPIAGVFNDTGTDPTEDQAAAIRITAKRALHINLRNVAGTEIGTSGAPVRTDPTGTTAQPVSSAATALDILKLEDAGHSTGDAGIMALSVRSSTATALAGTNLDYQPLITDATGQLYTTAAISNIQTRDTEDGSVAGGQSTVQLDIALPYSFDGTNWTRAGATPSKTVSAASTNATSVKASAGILYGIMASNVNASPRYLKLYNKASAPTVGSDTPVMTLIIPGNTAGSGFTFPLPPVGVNFATGIAFALTTEITDAGSTGVAANEIAVNLLYK